MSSNTVSAGIETERLVLREHISEDTNAILEIFGDIEVMRFFGMKPIQSLNAARKMIDYFKKSREEHGLNRWAIVLKDLDTVVGSVFYTNIEKPYFRAEIGYLLGRKHWGKGIMTEALEKIISFGFETMNLNKIQALITIDNQRSFALVERLGFCREGILKEHNFNYVDNKFDDIYAYALFAQHHHILRDGLNT